MKHTQEPWQLHQNYNKINPLRVPNDESPDFIHYELKLSKGDMLIGDVSGIRLCSNYDTGWPHVDNAEEVEANANRIIACVNGCAGIQNPTAIPEVVDALRATRAMLETLTSDQYALGGDKPIRDLIDAALAKLEGGGM